MKVAGRRVSLGFRLTENRTARIVRPLIAGWSSPVARRAHNPEVVGSNPTPAIRVKTTVRNGVFPRENWVKDAALDNAASFFVAVPNAECNGIVTGRTLPTQEGGCVMAGIRHATLYQRNGVWYVSYYQDGKRIQESTGTGSQRMAEDLRRLRDAEGLTDFGDVERDVFRALRDPQRRAAIVAAIGTAAVVPVDRAVAEYLSHSASYKRPKTIANDRGRLGDFVRSAEIRVLSEVTTKSVCDYLARRAAEVSATTLLRTREVLHAFFEWAKERMGYVMTNPVSKVPRPRPSEQDIDYLRPEHILIAIGAVRGDLIEGTVAIATYGGLRREEVCWLTWDDVDLVHLLIRIRSKKIDGVAWTPKTKRNRVVPISRQLHPFLLAQRMKHPIWVFPSPHGARWNPDNLSSRLRDLMSRAGKDWGFLTFRHTFGSLLAQKGLSFDKIADFMGNSALVVKKHYAALRPERGHLEVEFGIDLHSEIS